MGLHRDYRVYIGVHIGIMEKKMEATGVIWGYMGIRANLGVSTNCLQIKSSETDGLRADRAIWAMKGTYVQNLASNHRVSVLVTTLRELLD